MTKIFFILTLIFQNGETIVTEAYSLDDCIRQRLAQSHVVKFVCEPGNLATRVKYFGLEI